jgi:hypothetical protein
MVMAIEYMIFGAILITLVTGFTPSTNHYVRHTTRIFSNLSPDSLDWVGRKKVMGRRHWMGVTTSGIIATVTSPAIGEEQRLCDDAISVLKRGERTVYLMGSAHISSESAVLAQQLVRTAKPDTIFVELDKKRVMGKLGGGLGDAGAGSSGSTGGAGGGDGSGGEGSTVASQSRVLESAPAKLAETNSARDSTRGNQLNPFSALKGKLVAAAGAGLGKLIGGMYKQLDSAGFTSGAEFVVAINEGLKVRWRGENGLEEQKGGKTRATTV